MSKFKTLFLLFLTTVIWAGSIADCNKDIRFSFKNKPDSATFILKNPNRLVIDYKTSAKVLTNYYKFVDKVCIKSARTNSNKQNKTRIVYDLANTSSTTNHIVKTKLGYDLIVSLKSKTKKPNIIPVRDLIVVIDPGHGGFDPGAISKHGIKEKDITLAIAKKLALKINATHGMKAYLTRSNDSFIELRKRTELAKKYKADLFISIHADSHPNSSARGVSVYALSESGATSEAARILADKENNLYSDSKHSHHNYILQSVLIDLQQVSTVHQSLYLGKKILEKVASVAKRHSSRVEQAAFVVLKSTSIPSVLIESGFVSNKKEALYLTNSKYQDTLALSFLRAIEAYFKDKKPKNSYFDGSVTKKYIKVQKGDSLKKIAGKYKISIDNLIKLNHMTSDKIYVGQTLILPIHK